MIGKQTQMQAENRATMMKAPDTSLPTHELIASDRVEGTKVYRSDGTKIDDAGLRKFGKLPRLQGLSLSGTRVSDASVTEILTGAHLNFLNLFQTNITDAALAPAASTRRDRASSDPACRIAA